MDDTQTPTTQPAAPAYIPSAKRMCGPRGPEDSPFVIVGEAPGKHEIKEGKPFVGPSGEILNFALTEQVDPKTYPEPYITNTYKYLIQGEKNPRFLADLAMRCRDELLEEIGKYKRRVILASGGVAAMALTGNPDLKITQVRGTLYPTELADIGILATIHPAYLMRGGGSFRQFKADVMYSIHLAQGNSPRPWKTPTWSVVKDKEELQEHIRIIKSLPPGSVVAADLETEGFNHRSNRILSFGYTWDGDHIYIINGYKMDCLDPNSWITSDDGKAYKGGYPNLLHLFKEVWEAKQVRWAWHNGKFDIKFLWTLGQPAARCDDDTMLMSYALDEMRGLHDLETVASDWLYSPNWKGTLDKYKKKKQSYQVIPWPILYRYQAYDIANTFRLAHFLRGMLIADPIAKKQYDLSLMPASDYLADVENNGILVDEERVARNGLALTKEAEPIVKQMWEIALPLQAAPKEFSDKMHNSPKQLATIIFDRLQVPPKDPRVKLPRTTGDEVLDKLKQVPFIQLLRRYRKIAKQYGTYVKPYTRDPEKGCIRDDGRIHASYLIHGTATGRLASRDPNLQNIPRDPLIRGQFIAPPGRMFIEPDLNQAELRSLALLSGDKVLTQIYREGKISLHENTRRAMYGMPEDWSPEQIQGFMTKWFITPETRFKNGEDRILEEQKMKAKNVNFGIIYGITEMGLAEQTGESPRECKRWLETWAATYPEAWRFIQLCRNAPLFGRNIVTAFGYRKRFNVITPQNLHLIQNEAANFPHQSTASVITMQAGIRTYKELKHYDAFFVNTVHDSLLIECPLDFATATAVTKLVTSEMTRVPVDWGLTGVPFVADAKWGTRWGHLHKTEKGFAEHMGWIPPKIEYPDMEAA